ncbi:MAG: protein kinase [Prosthecobacter sp.]
MTTSQISCAEVPASMGSFEFERHLHKDSLGSTWRCLDRSKDIHVDLRLLPEWVFLDELRAWVSTIEPMTHRSLLRTLALAEEGGRSAVVSDATDGETLFQRRGRRPRRFFEISEIKPWIKALAEILSYLHGQGVAHGAIHGGNVFVEGTEIKLADLAVSRIIRPRTNEDRVLPLPAPAMSPQTLAGDAVDVADDVYGLASLVYDLLTGKPVFHSGDVTEQIRRVTPPSVTERRKQLSIEAAPVPEEWETWIAASLSKDPTKRPALEQVIILLGGSPNASSTTSSTSPATSAPRAPTKPYRRRPRLSINQWIVAAAAMITVSFSATIYTQRIVPRQELRKALDDAFVATSNFDEEAVTDHQAAIAKWDALLAEWQPLITAEHPDFEPVLARARVQRQARLDQQQVDEKTAKAETSARLDARLKKARADYEVVKLDAMIRPGDREKLVEEWNKFLADHDVVFEGKLLSDVIGEEINHGKTQRDQLVKTLADEKIRIEAAIAKTDAEVAKLRQLATDSSLPAADKIIQTESLLDQIASEPLIVLKTPQIEDLRKCAETLLAELKIQAEKETPKEPLALKEIFASSTCKDFSEPGLKRILQAAQAALKNLNLYAGRPDGGPGKETHEAIITFQKENRLVPNASLDDKTLTALGLIDLKDDATPMPQVASSSSRGSSSRGKSRTEEKSIGGKALDGVINVGKSIGGLFKGKK